jgi:hypothetical protein
MKKILYNTCYGGFGLSEEFIKHVNGSIDYQWYCGRDDQELIQKAIDFGLDKASGMFANLAITEIPDICNYEIDEYDGSESVNATLPVSMDELESGLSKEKLAVLAENPYISLVLCKDEEPKYDSAGFCAEDNEPTEADFWDGDESDKFLQ